jgi:hypothetical protein
MPRPQESRFEPPNQDGVGAGGSPLLGERGWGEGKLQTGLVGVQGAASEARMNYG